MDNSQIKELEDNFGENLCSVETDYYEINYKYKSTNIQFYISSICFDKNSRVIGFYSLNKIIINQYFKVPNINLIEQIKFLIKLYE